MNELVSHSDQKKHSEAEMKKEDTKVPEFRCPKCSKACNDYRFDWRAVKLFRQNFKGARFTYILIDVTSSMMVNVLNNLTFEKKSTIPRIAKTKEAVKQLLREISVAADPLDEAILTTFDDKLRKPGVIPQCKALNIATESNLKLVDAIELSPRSVQTHFYSVLKEIYEMFERESFTYVDLYIFSDGVDTSPKKSDKAYQAIIRGLNEKLGAKCHFMNCGSASEGFSVSAWLGDPEADCPMSGGVEEIKAQVKTIYERDHARTIDLASTEIRFRGKTLDVPIPKPTEYLTDAEAASLPKIIKRPPKNNESIPLHGFFRNSNPNFKSLFDYIPGLPSANRTRSSSATDSRPKSAEEYRIATRNLNARKIIAN